MTAVDPTTLPCLPIAYAIGGECIVLDHHAGEIELRDVEDLEADGTVLDASDLTARGMTEPASIPVLPLGVGE